MFLLSKDVDLLNYAILHGRGSLAQWLENLAMGSDRSLPSACCLNLEEPPLGELIDEELKE